MYEGDIIIVSPEEIEADKLERAETFKKAVEEEHQWNLANDKDAKVVEKKKTARAPMVLSNKMEVYRKRLKLCKNGIRKYITAKTKK